VVCFTRRADCRSYDRQRVTSLVLPHLIPHSTIIEIDAFLRIFERVTTSALWRQVVATSAPEIAQAHRVPQWIK
jgi:hypothetical protein